MKWSDKIKQIGTLWKALDGTAPSIFGVSPWQEKSGLSPGAGYAEQLSFYTSWASAAANAIALNVAVAKFRLFKDIPGEGEREEVIEHPIVKLLKGFNPFDTPFEFWELGSLLLDFSGNWYIYMAKDRLGIQRQFWTLPSDRIKIYPDRKKFIRGYELSLHGNKKLFFEAEEMLHFKLPNPTNRYYGMSTIMRAAYAADANKFMAEYSQGIYKNGAWPGAVLESDDEINDEEMARLEAQWDNKFVGTKNAAKMIILEGGMKMRPFSITPLELEFLRSKEVNRDEIAAIFGVPPSKMGIVKDVNRANAEANDYTFMVNTITPRLERLKQKMDLRLVSPLWPDLYVDYDSVIPKDKLFELKKDESDLKSGVITINERRRKQGKEEVPWGNVPLVPMNMAPLDIDPDNSDPEDEKIYKGFTRDLTAEEVLFDEALANETLGTKLGNQLMQALEEGYEKAIELLGIEGEIIWTPQADPRVEAILSKNLDKVKGINEATRKQLLESLSEGIAAGEDIAVLKARINKVYSFAEQSRAETIARTSATQGINQGQQYAMKDNDVEENEWLTQRDGNARESHSDADGQIRKLTEPFDIGGYSLSFPGDPAGPAQEVVNCRCFAIPKASKKGSDNRERLWKSIEAVRMPREKIAKRQLIAFFRAQRKEVLANFNEATKSMEMVWVN